ncbi:MAG: hypothetical protein HY042_07550, partial [Spirochaetia bacterium]|nr:hypothetical protein [Spirochaetia bacterium]
MRNRHNEYMMALLERIQASQTPSPEGLAAWAAKARPEELFRINLKRLERETGIPWQDLLPLFLQYVQQGIFNLSWEYHCPHCNGIPGFKHNFADLQSSGECAGCNVT